MVNKNKKLRILFASNKDRGTLCLKAVMSAGFEVVGLVGHPKKGNKKDQLNKIGNKKKISVERPENINDPKTIRKLKKLKPNIFVMAGYGQILKKNFIKSFSYGCINLHAGKLPEYRGSSPMNWSLINGEKEFGISVIKAAPRVDGGDVFLQRKFPIKPTDTILNLQTTANKNFPTMLVKVLKGYSRGTLKPKKQNENKSAYYPLRFPNDGFIIWDQLTAQEIHNRIRGLTDPYPNAFTYYNGKKINLVRSRMTATPYHGEPGRVYAVKKNAILISAKDQCLWIEKAVFSDSKKSFLKHVKRYESLVTLRGLALKQLED